MTRRFRTYLLRVVALTLCVLAATAALTAVIDPFGLYPSIHLDALEPYRTGRQTRTGRAGLLLRGDVQTVLIGSSRVEIGIAPRLGPDAMGRTYNVGLPGTHLTELPAVVDLALKENPDLERVLLALDFRMMRRSVPDLGDRDRSALTPGQAAPLYHAEKLLSHRTIETAALTVARALLKRPAPHGPDGHYAGYRALPMPLDKRIAHEVRKVQARAFAGYKYEPALLDEVRRMIAACVDAGVRVDVAILPMHPALLESIRINGLWDDFERFKRDLAQLVAAAGNERVRLWDMGRYDPAILARLAPDAGSEVFTDPSHFTPEVGGWVLHRIYGDGTGGPPIGVRLDGTDVDELLAEDRAAAQRYRAAHPDLIELIERELRPANRAADR